MIGLLLTGALANILFAGAVPALGTRAEAPLTVDQALLRQARFWRAHGRPEIARDALRRLLTIDPGNVEARAGLRALAPRPASSRPTPADVAAQGFHALDAGDLAAAETLFRRALAADARQSDALGGLGLIRLKTERFDEARGWLARAAEADKQGRWTEPLAAAEFYANLRKAEGARDRGALDEAESLARPLAGSTYKNSRLAAALLEDLGRRRATADFDRALAAWRAGDSPTAEAAFRRSLTEAPEAPWPRYRYAVFLTDARRTDEATTVMRGMRATSADARFATALFLDASGRSAEAADSLDAIAPAERTSDMTRFEQQLRCELAVQAARVLGQAGHARAASAGLRRLAHDPALSNASLSLLADGLFELGDHTEALALVDRALAAPLSAPSDYEGAVSVLARAGRSDEASALIARLAAATDSPRAAAELARLRARAALGAADRYSKQGHFARAITELRRQLAVTPDDSELQLALGRTWLAAGDAPRAVQSLQALVAARPEDEGAWRELARAALAARQPAQARDALARAQALTPEDQALDLAAAEVHQASGEDLAALRELRAASAARARARSGDLDGLIEPRILARTRGDFDLVAFGPDPIDPAGEQLSRRLDQLYDKVSPAIAPSLAWSHRSGEAGLSQLATTNALLTGLVPAGPGRLQLAAGYVRLDAGDLDAAAESRFGAGPLAPASAAFTAPKTAISGATFEGLYKMGDLSAGAGVTQFSGRTLTAQGEVQWAPRLGRELQGEFSLSRKPVVESLLAYAGMTDPRLGVSWGQVSRSGGRAGLTLSRGDAGVYGVAGAYAYDGRNVRANASFQVDLGAYARLAGGERTSLTGGLNVDVQGYRHNEDAFTFGHGGYFSPQQFVAITAPLRLTSRAGPWRVDARVAPGYQSYREGDAPVFPTAAALQAALPAEQSVLAGSRRRGPGASGEAKLEYAASAGMVLAAEAGADTFGAYREAHAVLKLKVRLGEPR